MRCVEFEQRLHQLLDQRACPRADAPLTAHAQLCERCRDTLRIQQRLFEALEADLDDSLDDFRDDGLAARVVALATPAILSPWHGRSASYLAVATIAILLLLALLPRGFSQPDVATARRSTPAPGAAPAPGAPAAPGGPPAPGGPAIARPRATERAGVGESESTGQHPQPRSPQPRTTAPAAAAAHRGPRAERYSATSESEEVDRRPHSDAVRLPRELEMLEPFLTRLPDDSVDQLAGGLRPLADSFSAAFETLRRTFPLGRELRGVSGRSAARLLLGLQA